MNLMSLLTNHYHYWGIPHERSSDKRLIQICYECGAEREIKVDLRPYGVPAGAESQACEIKAALSPLTETRSVRKGSPAIVAFQLLRILTYTAARLNRSLLK
jgi:hypothetical protein